MRTQKIDPLMTGGHAHLHSFPLRSGRVLFQPVESGDVSVDVPAGEVGIRREHICTERAPHHELDRTLLGPLLEEMGDPGMSEEMRGEVLGDPCPLGNPADLSGDSVPFQLLAGFGEEYRRVFSKRERVIGPPFGEVLLCHDQPDVSGDPGLEIDIHGDTLRIGLQVPPRELADLTRTESPFVEGHDHCPVPGTPAELDQGLDLFGRQELGRGFRLGIPPRGFDALDLLLR